MDIFIQKFELNDFDAYYNLRCEKENIYWTGYISAPSRDTLKTWCINQLKKEDRLFFLVKLNNPTHKVIGYLYLDIDEVNKDTVCISLAVSSNYTGLGIGTKIITLAMEYCKNNIKNITNLEAFIMPHNIASSKCFLKNNWFEVDEFKEFFSEILNTTITMKKYVYFFTK
ncbi:Protein N-acetyltransferase, RimJ/RimL family [Clostridium cavendishii DSM 21758]|uniref:Protein N-acetyltransferase, RimJ/RimL family n=1 Tax=Clostridium cavendishii DSM 21758 TaxID=1121302 RepID=A0A1M6QAG7_9CLOT|nr:GNAT family N-acetyltransferase [Clostridium cavendishii]SHK17130.1 Protein N-acetyltransferase, RimJ/RimL family [Clostridium cavendishii DSM 21758]